MASKVGTTPLIFSALQYSEKDEPWLKSKLLRKVPEDEQQLLQALTQLADSPHLVDSEKERSDLIRDLLIIMPRFGRDPHHKEVVETCEKLHRMFNPKAEVDYPKEDRASRPKIDQVLLDVKNCTFSPFLADRLHRLALNRGILSDVDKEALFTALPALAEKLERTDEDKQIILSALFQLTCSLLPEAEPSYLTQLPELKSHIVQCARLNLPLFSRLVDREHYTRVYQASAWITTFADDVAAHAVRKALHNKLPLTKLERSLTQEVRQNARALTLALPTDTLTEAQFGELALLFPNITSLRFEGYSKHDCSAIVRHFPNLEKLHLGAAPSSAAEWASLGQLHALTSLTFDDGSPDLTADTIRQLPSTLEEICFPFRSPLKVDLTVFQRFAQLRHLAVVPGIDQAQAIDPLLRPPLESLTLLGDWRCNNLGAFQALTSLKKVHFYWPTTPQNLQFLPQSFQFLPATLEELTYNCHSDGFIQDHHIASLQHITSLKRLTIGYHNSEWFNDQRDFIQQSQFTGSTLHLLPTSLEEVTLGFRFPVTAQPQVLRPTLPHIRRLVLDGSFISSGYFDLGLLQSLEALTVCTPSPTITYDFLLRLPKLRSFSISGENVSPLALATCLPDTIEHLVLAGGLTMNEITNDHFKKRLRELKTLKLYNTTLTNDFFDSLSDSLVELSLGYCIVSLDDFDHLRHLHQLKLLNLIVTGKLGTIGRLVERYIYQPLVHRATGGGLQAMGIVPMPRSLGVKRAANTVHAHLPRSRIIAIEQFGLEHFQIDPF